MMISVTQASSGVRASRHNVPRPARLSVGVGRPSAPGMSALRAQAPRIARRGASERRVRAHAPAAAEEAKVDPSYAPKFKPEISLESLESLDIRTAYIAEAMTVDVEVEVRRGDQVRMRKKALLKMKVDIGTESRIIVSDIVPIMDAESAVGKKIMIVANTPKEVVAGHNSHGRVITGHNYDPTPMAHSFRDILPGAGKLPPGSQYTSN